MWLGLSQVPLRRYRVLDMPARRVRTRLLQHYSSPSRRSQGEWPTSSMPTFRGPIHRAMAASRPKWTNPSLWTTPQHQTGFQPYNHGPQQSMLTTQYSFPPQPPLHPPPPPPSCPSTPHRFCTTTPKSPSGLTPPQTTSPVSRGYTIRPVKFHRLTHGGVQFVISHLPRWLRTRPFSEPTFRPSGTTKHWKNTVFCDFFTCSRTCIFFFLTLSLLWSSSFSHSLLRLFPPLLFHLSILSDVWLLNFLRSFVPSAAPPPPRHHHHHYHHRQDEPQHRHHDHHEHHQYLWWMDLDKNQPQKTIYILSITDYHNYIPLFPCACSQILMHVLLLRLLVVFLVLSLLCFFPSWYFCSSYIFLAFCFFLFVFPLLLFLFFFLRLRSANFGQRNYGMHRSAKSPTGWVPQTRNSTRPVDSEGLWRDNTMGGLRKNGTERCATIATMTPIHIRKEVGFNLIKGSAPDFRLVWKFATQIWCTTVCCGWDFDPMGPWDCSAVL